MRQNRLKPKTKGIVLREAQLEEWSFQSLSGAQRSRCQAVTLLLCRTPVEAGVALLWALGGVRLQLHFTLQFQVRLGLTFRSEHEDSADKGWGLALTNNEFGY